jgi:hypothetical protein
MIWLAIPVISAQPKDNPCNKTMTFCWYGPFQDESDEVEAHGTIWKSDDPSVKSLEQTSEVRCIKKLSVCIHARNQKVFSGVPSVTSIDLYNVRSWGNTEVRAVMDEQFAPDCEQDTLVINRVDQSTVIISSPGSRGNEKHCTGFMGEPRTVMYRLLYPEMDTVVGSSSKKK